MDVNAIKFGVKLVDIFINVICWTKIVYDAGNDIFERPYKG